jgi:hypothetical protein
MEREEEEVGSPRLQYFVAWVPKRRMATTEESYRTFFTVQVFFPQGPIRRRRFDIRSQSYNHQHRFESPTLREKTLRQERNLKEQTTSQEQSWIDSQRPSYRQILQETKRLLRAACFIHGSATVCPKDRLFDRTKKETSPIFLLTDLKSSKCGLFVWFGVKAGPVGFEPTILGSEGPRLGPGSTTGPENRSCQGLIFSREEARKLILSSLVSSLF